MLERECLFCGHVYQFGLDACPRCKNHASQVVWIDGRRTPKLTDEIARALSDEDLQKLMPFKDPIVREWLWRNCQSARKLLAHEHMWSRPTGFPGYEVCMWCGLEKWGEES